MNIPPLNVAVSALCFAADGNPLGRRSYGIRLDSDVVCEDSIDRRIFDIDISLSISLLAVPERTSALIGGGELKLSGRHPLTLLKEYRIYGNGSGLLRLYFAVRHQGTASLRESAMIGIAWREECLVKRNPRGVRGASAFYSYAWSIVNW